MSTPLAPDWLPPSRERREEGAGIHSQESFRPLAKSSHTRAQGPGSMCWTNPVTPGNTTRRALGNRSDAPRKSPRTLLPQACGSQDEDGGLDVFQQRSQVTAGVALKAAHHAGGGGSHLRRVPSDIGRIDYIRVQTPGDGAFNPRGHPLTVDKVGAFGVVRVVEARR